MEWKIVACFLLSTTLWLLICFTMRYTLKLLLLYKGFLSETPGKGIRLKTKLWAGLVKGNTDDKRLITSADDSTDNFKSSYQIL